MMDMATWTQEPGLTAMNPSMAEATPFSSKPLLIEKKIRPQKEQALNCPRCNSTNTKFCYYNNYSQSQPRYFCKSCRRYWTEGGSLRNVPVGGGSRKNKRSISKRLADLGATGSLGSSSTYDGKDLNLTFPTPQDYKFGLSNSSEASEFDNSSSSSLSAVDFLKNNIGLSTKSNLSHFFPTNYNEYYGASLGQLNDFRQNTLSADGFTGFENFQGIAERGRLGVAIEDLKQNSQTGFVPAGDASVYWPNGAFGGTHAWTHIQNYGP